MSVLCKYSDGSVDNKLFIGSKCVDTFISNKEGDTIYLDYPNDRTHYVYQGDLDKFSRWEIKKICIKNLAVSTNLLIIPMDFHNIEIHCERAEITQRLNQHKNINIKCDIFKCPTHNFFLKENNIHINSKLFILDEIINEKFPDKLFGESIKSQFIQLYYDYDAGMNVYINTGEKVNNKGYIKIDKVSDVLELINDIGLKDQSIILRKNQYQGIISNEKIFVLCHEQDKSIVEYKLANGEKDWLFGFTSINKINESLKTNLAQYD